MRPTNRRCSQFGFAGIVDAEGAPHHALATVATGEIGASPALPLTVAFPHGFNRDAVMVGGKSLYAPAEAIAMFGRLRRCSSRNFSTYI